MPERFYNAIRVTIPPNSNLTDPIDLMGYGVVGLIAETPLTSATLSFEVAPTETSLSFYELRKDDGTPVVTGLLAGSFALGADGVLKHLSAYRYVRIKTSVNQPSGVTFRITLRP